MQSEQWCSAAVMKQLYSEFVACVVVCQIASEHVVYIKVSQLHVSRSLILLSHSVPSHVVAVKWNLKRVISCENKSYSHLKSEYIFSSFQIYGKTIDGHQTIIVCIECHQFQPKNFWYVLHNYFIFSVMFFMHFAPLGFMISGVYFLWFLCGNT